MEIVREKAAKLNIPDGIYCGEAVGIEGYRLKEREKLALKVSGKLPLSWCNKSAAIAEAFS
jgi:hypothetical protein